MCNALFFGGKGGTCNCSWKWLNFETHKELQSDDLCCILLPECSLRQSAGSSKTSGLRKMNNSAGSSECHLPFSQFLQQNRLWYQEQGQRAPQILCWIQPAFAAASFFDQLLATFPVHPCNFCRLQKYAEILILQNCVPWRLCFVVSCVRAWPIFFPHTETTDGQNKWNKFQHTHKSSVSWPQCPSTGVFRDFHRFPCACVCVSQEEISNWSSLQRTVACLCRWDMMFQSKNQVFLALHCQPQNLVVVESLFKLCFVSFPLSVCKTQSFLNGWSTPIKFGSSEVNCSCNTGKWQQPPTHSHTCTSARGVQHTLRDLLLQWFRISSHSAWPRGARYNLKVGKWTDWVHQVSQK